MRIPKLCWHKTSKQFYVWDGSAKTRLHFGTDPTAARQRYAEWLAGHGGPPALPVASAMVVDDALEAYRRHADQKYTDPRERQRIALALRAVSDLYGRQPAASFKAKAIRDVRARLLTGGTSRSRRYVNKLVRAVQTAWRWLATEELVPAESAASVCLVRALSPGEGGRERPPVLPPAPGAVEAALPHLPSVVAAMLRVQLLTGARPGEVRAMRVGEVSTDPAQPVPLAGTGRTVAALRCGGTVVWMYAPGSHKTLRRGKSRVVPIGPLAQAVLVNLLMGKRPEDPVFHTPTLGCYRADSYARAVARACRAAGIPPFSPLQLRHGAGTAMAEAFDDHTAASVLGHAPGSTATAVYLEQSVRKAAEAAAKIG